MWTTRLMKILFVTTEGLRAERSGPAIRCMELARVVSSRHEVTIAAMQPSTAELAGVRIISEALRKKSELNAAVKSAEVVVMQGLVLARYPALAGMAKHLVVDLYDPYLLEYLEHAHPRHPSWGYLRQWHRLNQQMLAADFFLCANDRQWDYWFGRLCALGRLNPEEYRDDPSFQRLLAIVPFGLPAAAPEHKREVLKGVVPGIGKRDFLLLWAGGLWQWLDPLTPIRAMKEVAARRPEIKLVFLGGKDPNPANRPMTMAAEAEKLARELGLLGKSVFFVEDWVAYDERQNYLLEADVGISAHPATVESRFAFRTRVLDYIWAGLPMILSAGDSFAELVARENLGRAVAPGDSAAWASAILALTADENFRRDARSRLHALAPQFTWERAAAPLLKYCHTPYHTARPSLLRKKLAPLLSSGYEIAKGLRG
jgi:glycosyltransferase involved in cell wall biosynthesis